MSAKKAKELRKKLGMTKENLKQTDHVRINPVEKVVYFRNELGIPVPQKTQRTQVINRNKYYYRKQKKLLKKES